VLTGVGPVGTPAYMAPEVCLGHTATAASDQYSLACTAYEMFAGKPPFDSCDDLISAHVEQEPDPVASLYPDIQEPVAAAIHRGLAKDPSSRFTDVRQLAQADARSRTAFEQATSITKTVREVPETDELVRALVNEHGLSDATIAAVADVDPARVARLRRRAARAALVGASSGRGARRRSSTDHSS